MSVDAPERIWISPEKTLGLRTWSHRKEFPDAFGEIPYIRADKLEELAAKYETAMKCYEGCSHLREQAEDALAEKDKEIAALREALKETQSNLKAGSTRRAVIRLIDEVLSRNTGGKDAGR